MFRQPASPHRGAGAGPLRRPRPWATCH
jgi:hypothetical protein